jgi:hypothetical protein
MEKETLKAVHDDDLETLLRRLGLHSDFTHSRLKCTFCKDVITFDNLHSLFPDSGAVKLTCSKPECVNQLLSRIEARRK